MQDRIFVRSMIMCYPGNEEVECIMSSEVLTEFPGQALGLLDLDALERVILRCRSAPID
jgi:hypothetical protein